jgi:hypothetical protein
MVGTSRTTEVGFFYPRAKWQNVLWCSLIVMYPVTHV